MKNFISILLLALLFSPTLQADATQMHAKEIIIEEVEQYPFIGLVGAYNSDFENNALIGFRFGMQNNVWRTSFTYEENFDEYKAFLIQVDRTIVAGLFSGLGRIYIGASGGWIDTGDTPTEILDLDTLESISSDGYTIGVNIGLMYYISDQLDLSIDYRYLSVEDVMAIDKITGFSIALHYFF